jgi:pimeloyl-ACP methyl ester carboxylesterase
MSLPTRERAEAGVLDAAALATEHLDTLVLGAVRDIHGSIARRARAGRIHDGIAAGVYAGIGLGFRGAARAMRAANDLGVGPAIEVTPRGRFVVSAVNGLIGDRLAEDGSALAIEAGVRLRGRDVVLTHDGLAAAYPQATDALVVFLHGLCETESYWNRRSRPLRPESSGTDPYGARLAADEGWTPVYLRTNSGLSAAESGVTVSSLLGRLVDAWPTPVRRIALVGHSQGGLVAHAACAVARSGEGAWTGLLTDVVTLGAPHTGSPVERSIARGVRLANRVPELAPFARVFEQRSVGVLDLAEGMPEEPVALPGVRYHLVAATLSRSARHPVAATLGDSLVPYRSAIGRLPGGRKLFPGADVLHVPGADHFDLLNHDNVYAALANWLAHRTLTQETA